MCWNIDKQNCETLSLLQFSKHMLLCARVCESVIVLARLRMCAYVCQKNKLKKTLYALLMSIVADARLSQITL